MSFVANFTRFAAMQRFWKLVKIWQSWNFFETQCRYMYCECY